MSAPLHVAVVTGSRAEYGLLYWPIVDMLAAEDLKMSLVVTGSHLSRRHGHTVDAIRADGVPIAEEVPIDLHADDRSSTVRALAQATEGCGAAFERLRPDLVMVLGDRFEILGAVQAASLSGIPVVHVGGGDVTAGAFDDSIRHAITKLSHLHLVTNEESAARVRQLGESPERVHVVGNPGLDHIERRERMPLAELEASLGVPLGPRNLLFTFHPVTMERDLGRGQLERLLEALVTELAPAGETDARLFVTGANADPGFAAIGAALDRFVAANARWVHAYPSLGQARYLSLMDRVDAVVGNSSSGLTEAPSFGVWSVDVGNRQAGRLAGETVLHCESDVPSIREALQVALAGPPPAGLGNPYGDGHTSPRILRILRDAPAPHELLQKHFQDLP
ncbi:GDP/UDP-N,N'-diacetylbacillosamine 2-epimerase (hydrolyzing) [Planctomycetes bacterium Poly30]|uniref:GDP/UDP-N,N'-diacetylbacillosamine 2-epimerase (Hydrolyzing) n=1 Tax=Saltatorellus ferox TaxID=2528018 RepID=A0A518EX36_9BACT|nr:GDP/UDP-N,N'-diacetylbacillosamine 2-epimerase (hydrolyzing) [Planctomycetes bacterium Poly30]